MRLSAVGAWRLADAAATDVEAALRIEFIKYAEGIAGPPGDELVLVAIRRRNESNQRLIEALRAHDVPPEHVRRFSAAPVAADPAPG